MILCGGGEGNENSTCVCHVCHLQIFMGFIIIHCLSNVCRVGVTVVHVYLIESLPFSDPPLHCSLLTNPIQSDPMLLRYFPFPFNIFWISFLPDFCSQSPKHHNLKSANSSCCLKRKEKNINCDRKTAAATIAIVSGQMLFWALNPHELTKSNNNHNVNGVSHLTLQEGEFTMFWHRPERGRFFSTDLYETLKYNNALVWNFFEPF